MIFGLGKPVNALENRGLDWARGWNEQTQELLLGSLSALQNNHEALWKSGDGRLRQARHWQDIPWDEEVAFCDQGVLVLPKAILNGELFIIGDLHGDLSSLEKAINVTGILDGTPHCSLLFLGDYGDRGVETLGVWATLAVLKEKFPARVHLLRGNHEELIEVKLLRAEDDRPMQARWFIPSNNKDAETYFALGHLLPGVDAATGGCANLQNVEELFRYLPSVALIPDDGTLVLHGGILPCWRPKDGWPLSDPDKEPLRVDGIQDLCKPKVQQVTRWSRPFERDELDNSWANPKEPDCAKADMLEWQTRLGIKRLIHGHTHPEQGVEIGWGGARFAVNTSKKTGEVPAMLKRQTNSEWVSVPLD